MSRRRTKAIPLYVSVTSIFRNQEHLYLTLQSIVEQTRVPDKIFVYLCEEPYLLDAGFKDKEITNLKLKEFIKANPLIVIRWVRNIGSFRKLLPLLKEKWDEDCVIITIDDDAIYDRNLIGNLVEDHNKVGCMVSYRGFTPMAGNQLNRFEYYRRARQWGWGGVAPSPPSPPSLYNFPTGKGGILYKPQFFHKTKGLIFNEHVFTTTCDKQDDIWFYLVRILNRVPCYIRSEKWRYKDISTFGLFETFNKYNNLNTKAFNGRTRL